MKKNFIYVLIIMSMFLFFNCSRDNPISGTPPVTPIPTYSNNGSSGGLIDDDNILGIYNETYSGIVVDVDAKLYIWSYTCTLSEEITSDAPEKQKVMKVTSAGVGWLGFGYFSNPNPSDMSAYSNGHLRLRVKSSDLSGLQVGIQDGTTKVELNLSGYGYAADGTWHSISIPISDFAGVDLSNITYWIEFVDNSTPPASGDVFYYDFVYWDKQ